MGKPTLTMFLRRLQEMQSALEVTRLFVQAQQNRWGCEFEEAALLRISELQHRPALVSSGAMVRAHALRQALS